MDVLVGFPDRATNRTQDASPLPVLEFQHQASTLDRPRRIDIRGISLFITLYRVIHALIASSGRKSNRNHF
jgi:hypothetical protein